VYGNCIFDSVKEIQTRGKNYKYTMIQLIEQFEPLIKKYSNLLSYEDSQSELTLAFIETIYKIPTHNAKFKQDKYIISYINKSIKNTYILLSKNRNKKYYYESPINLDITEASYQLNIEDKLFVDELLALLTEKEKEIIILKYFKEYSDMEISKKFGISRQAVNKTKNRAIKKMKKCTLVS
jgi:RNA polymerase sigma factor (sigma-70 family)